MKKCVEFGRTTFLPSKTIGEKISLVDNEVLCGNVSHTFQFEQDNGDDFDQLHTPLDNGCDQEYEKFPTYKNGEGINFQLGTVFKNKEMVRDTLKYYAIECKKNVFHQEE